MASAVRRAGEHLGRLSLLAFVVALAVAGIGGIEAVAEHMLADGAARILTGAEPGARTVRVVATASADGDVQDQRVREAISTAFAGTDIVVSRVDELEAALSAPADVGIDLRLRDDERVADLAALETGEWPQSPNQIAVSDAAAQRQHLRLGDTVALARDSTVLEVVGIWTALDPADPAWHGDPAVASGRSGGAIGPAVVAPGALAELPGTPTVTWEVAPVSVDPGDIAGLQRALTTLRGLPEAIDPQRRSNTRILGNLGDTLQRQAAAISATRGLLVAPLLIMALLGVLVLGTVLTTLSFARRDETVLLRARGASRWRVGAGAAAEAAAFAAVGALIAMVFLVIGIGATGAVLMASVGAIAFAAVFSGMLTTRAAVGADVVRPETLRSDAGVRTLRMLLLPTGIVVGAAGLAAWQLFATGTVVRSDGTPEPLAAAAPALLLVAACALAPVAASPLAALAERLLRRTRGVAPILPLRQIARQMGSVAVGIMCLALAAAAVTLAVAAPAAAGAAEQRSRVALLGGDVRMIAGDGPDTSAGTAESWDGVLAATEVLSTPLTVGSDTVELVAGPPEALGFAERIPPGESEEVAVGVTRSLADRLGADTGTVFTARIRSVARPVPFEIVRVVDALPGVGDGWGVAVDPEELADAGVDLAANELRVRSAAPNATAEQLRAEATQPVRILTAAQVSAAPVTSIVPTLLAGGALVAAVLGLIGFAAASSATNRVRRGESHVLRALGLRPSRQRALRAGETASVALYALIAGSAAGAVVAAAVLPIVLGVGA